MGKGKIIAGTLAGLIMASGIAGAGYFGYKTIKDRDKTIDEQKTTIGQLEEDNKVSKEKIEGLTKDLSAKVSELAEKDKQIVEKDNLISENNNKIKTLNSQKTTLLASVSEIDNKLTSTTDAVDVDNLEARKMAILGQIDTLNADIANLTAEKTQLQQEIETLTTEKTQLQNQIDSLNKQIVELTNKLNNVSRNLNNATVTFKYTYNNLAYSVFDDAGNYDYQGGHVDTKILATSCSRQDLLNFVNQVEKDIKVNLPKSANSSRETCLFVYDVYEIEIQHQTLCMDVVHDETYSFTSNTNLSTKILLNGNQIDIEELSTSLDSKSKYSYSLNFEYSVNADNQITDFTCKITITNN